MNCSVCVDDYDNEIEMEKVECVEDLWSHASESHYQTVSLIWECPKCGEER